MSAAPAFRVVAVADTDSYLKWAAATLAALPTTEARLVVVETPAAPSAAQRSSALRGTGIDVGGITTIPIGALAAHIADQRSDAVLVAMRGPQARTAIRLLAAVEPRPVIVTGMPGISIPATRKALFFRAQADLFVVHSRRERQEFAALADRHGWDPRIAVARLPFAVATARAGAHGTDLVFAVQSLVPREPADRERIARMLLRAADADPARRVVVKVRAVAGERQTHDEDHPIPELVASVARADGRSVPANLVISSVAMQAALDSAEGLVTVSSTAAIEAVARGIPVIALDDFGVSDALINPVFRGSGLFGDLDDAVARRFRQPVARWLDDNYLHPPSGDDLAAHLADLVAARRAGELPARAELAVVGGSVRRRWQRQRAFPGSDRGIVAALVAIAGFTARPIVRTARRAAGLARARGAEGQTP